MRRVINEFHSYFHESRVMFKNVVIRYVTLSKLLWMMKKEKSWNGIKIGKVKELNKFKYRTVWR